MSVCVYVSMCAICLELEKERERERERVRERERGCEGEIHSSQVENRYLQVCHQAIYYSATTTSHQANIPLLPTLAWLAAFPCCTLLTLFGQILITRRDPKVVFLLFM